MLVRILSCGVKWSQPGKTVYHVLANSYCTPIWSKLGGAPRRVRIHCPTQLQVARPIQVTLGHTESEPPRTYIKQLLSYVVDQCQHQCKNRPYPSISIFSKMPRQAQVSLVPSLVIPGQWSHMYFSKTFIQRRAYRSYLPRQTLLHHNYQLPFHPKASPISRYAPLRRWSFWGTRSYQSTSIL